MRLIYETAVKKRQDKVYGLFSVRKRVQIRYNTSSPSIQLNQKR